jgi:hypothetical protein
MDAGGAKDEGAILRTAKSCGPDAPTLASSSWEVSFLGMTGATKPGHRLSNAHIFVAVVIED